MIIANPIDDEVFKRMMENDRIAKFFIGTLLDQTIESVELRPQERKIEIEQEARRTVNAMFAEKEENYQRQLQEAAQALSAKDQIIEALRKQLGKQPD